MAIFFCVAVLFEEIGFVRPYGDDRAIILSGFMVKKEASAVNDSIANLEKILNQVCKIKTAFFNNKNSYISLRLLKKLN